MNNNNNYQSINSSLVEAGLQLSAMPLHCCVTQSVIKTIRGIRPYSLNHFSRHFQSKTISARPCKTITMNKMVRWPRHVTSHLYVPGDVVHSSSFSRSAKMEKSSRTWRQTYEESSDDEINDETDGYNDISEDLKENSEEIPFSMTFHGINSFSMRSHTCNELNINHVGEQVSLYGWVEAKRGDNFIILRDGYGRVQICLAEYTGKGLDASLPPESVIHIVGTVVQRSPEHINKEMATGEIEVKPTNANIISTVQKSLPFSLKGYNKPKENLRLKHRYLHFRFPEVQHALRLRSNILHKMRRYLVEECSFVEVETPTLFGKTPGGAQEFVVPTKHSGKCYSLVQSPQQFKQMLMVGGFDRYFQVARCYRDEDSRSDRQPEFTQLDLELSFSDMEGVMNLTEQILKHSWPEDPCGRLSVPFPRLKYANAMQVYGTDKPDLRYSTKIKDYTNFLTPFFQHRELNNVRFLTYIQKGKCYSETLQKEVNKIIDAKQSETLPGTVKLFPYESKDSFYENLRPVLSEKVIRKLFCMLDGTQPGDLVVVGYGPEEKVLNLLSSVRVPIAQMCGIPPACRFAPLWVTHFPLFERGALIGRFKPAHHPFTNICKGSVKMFLGSPLHMESLSYDLVINGQEIGGGSERINNPEFQVKVLEKIGANPKDFEYFLDALSYGCPPHAGIALGVDRLLACLLDAESIRDVIAFPKTFNGTEPLTGAPFTPSSADKTRYRLK